MLDVPPENEQSLTLVVGFPFLIAPRYICSHARIHLLSHQHFGNMSINKVQSHHMKKDTMTMDQSTAQHFSNSQSLFLIPMLCHNNQQHSILESCDDRVRQMGGHTVEKLEVAGLVFSSDVSNRWWFQANF
jgi:hypothetical protein